MMNPDSVFWNNKRVLITGHSGFKGGWLAIWLAELGAKVTGISLPPLSTPNLFDLAGIKQLCTASYFCDIRNAGKLAGLIEETAPEVIFHLAAQPLVKASYKAPLETFSTNIMGTANLLDALRSNNSVKVVIMVTTDKVYKNKNWEWPYRETDELGGHDPYSSSKAASELLIESYRKSFLENKGIAIASARAGNVIGGGDWSEDRLIPDAIRAWENQLALYVRNPKATRPWQHVLEPLTGYLLLAEKLWKYPVYAGAYNFGPHTHEAATVKAVVGLAQVKYPTALVYSVEENTESVHEAQSLALDNSRVRSVLGYQPRWGLQRSVEHTINWYLNLQSGASAKALCLQDLKTFLLSK